MRSALPDLSLSSRRPCTIVVLVLGLLMGSGGNTLWAQPALPQTSQQQATALLEKAEELVATGQLDDALSLLLEAKEQTTDPTIKVAVLRQLEAVYLAKPDYLRAIDSAAEVRALSTGDHRLASEGRVWDLVKNKLSEQDLRRLADRYPRTFPGDLALLRLLELHAASGEDHKLTRTAREFLERFPTHEQTSTVTDMVTTFQTTLNTKSFLIGALLPLSGALSPYGTQVLNGIKVALDHITAEAAPPFSVGLVIKDTQGDPRRLMVALDELLGDYKPVTVIGPLLTREVKAVAAAADSHEVVFITPTATIPDVQHLSPHLFNTAVNNRALVRVLAAHAIGVLGWRRFCVLASQDTYGTDMTLAFTEEIRQLGGEIIAADTYGPQATDFGPPLKRIKAADLKRDGKLEPAGKKRGKTITMYRPGFDALFLPGEAEKVSLIAGQLPFYAAKIPILGTNGMNAPNLIRSDSHALEGAIFADSFFVDSPDPAVRDFVELYVRRFQKPPSAFAAQAYEATRLVLDAMRKGATTGRDLRNSLATMQNAPGLAGPLAMTPEGHLERQYVLIQVKGGTFVQVSGSPILSGVP